jgi:site-specific recombinase XerD
VVVVPLSELGVVAWRMWLDHNPWNIEKRRWTMPSMSNANRDWKRAMTRAGFQPTCCYSLLHSYCTQLLTAGGGDISLVSKARGHRDIRTTIIYTQVVVDPRLASAVKRAFCANAK